MASDERRQRKLPKSLAAVAPLSQLWGLAFGPLGADRMTGPTRQCLQYILHWAETCSLDNVEHVATTIATVLGQVVDDGTLRITSDIDVLEKNCRFPLPGHYQIRQGLITPLMWIVPSGAERTPRSTYDGVERCSKPPTAHRPLHRPVPSEYAASAFDEAVSCSGRCHKDVGLPARHGSKSGLLEQCATGVRCPLRHGLGWSSGRPRFQQYAHRPYRVIRCARNPNRNKEAHKAKMEPPEANRKCPAKPWRP